MSNCPSIWLQPCCLRRVSYEVWMDSHREQNQLHRESCPVSRPPTNIISCASLYRRVPGPLPRGGALQLSTGRTGLRLRITYLPDCRTPRRIRTMFLGGSIIIKLLYTPLYQGQKQRGGWKVLVVGFKQRWRDRPLTVDLDRSGMMVSLGNMWRCYHEESRYRQGPRGRCFVWAEWFGSGRSQMMIDPNILSGPDHCQHRGFGEAQSPANTIRRDDW
jgi:hypothetical protein